MRNRMRHAACVFAISTSLLLSACADGKADDCSAALADQTTLATEHFAGDTLVFRHVADGASDNVEPVELVRYRSSQGCQPERVDLYEEDGGQPKLEATFVHQVKGEPNLFAIVSWPLLHAGLDMRGTYYAVYAYRRSDDALVRNDAVVKNRELYGGIVGTVEGEPSTFEGTTRDGVVAMLRRLELE